MTPILTTQRRFFRGRRFPTAAICAVLALSACSSPAPPPVPPPPPAPPPIALSGAVLQSAADYQAYMNDVAAIKTDFGSGDDVARALKVGDDYDPQQLLQGAIAYGAIVALQDPAFVASLRTFAADPDSRRQMTAKILADPYYVTAMAGADSAGGLVIATLMDQGQKVAAAGAAVKQSAYDIQHQDWSKDVVPDRDARLAYAKNPADMSLMSTSADVERLREAAVGVQPLALTAAANAASAYPPAVVRALAVAALAALGQAGDDNTALVQPLIADPASANCLNMAKLNLYQCLAVSRPHYEDVFCLGQHAMMDTGQCVMIAAGAPPPVVQPLPVSSTETAYAPKPAKKASRKKKPAV